MPDATAGVKAWQTRRRREAARKAWVTIRERYGENAGNRMARKAWRTRRAQ